jgi:hypothetical protein
LRSRIINPFNKVANQVTYNCYLAQFEPKKVEEALQDDSWVTAMHDELHQFNRNDVWTLVPRPSDQISSAQSGFSRTNQTNMAQ